MDSVRLLRRDIVDPNLNGTGSLADDFMLYANQAGLAFIENGLFSSAIRLYTTLLSITTDYSVGARQARHTGALLANLGAAYLMLGNLDHGVEHYLRAAESDAETYGISQHQSYALTDLLEERFAVPITRAAVALTRKVVADVTEQRIRSLRQVFGENEFALLASIHQVWLHSQGRQSARLFGRLQLLGGLRHLAILLEIRAKTMAAAPEATLRFRSSVRTIYFENDVIRNGLLRGSGTATWASFPLFVPRPTVTGRKPAAPGSALDDKILK